MSNKKIPLSNEFWSWIKYQLAIKGYPSFRALGKAYKYSDGAFKNVKNYACPANEKIIADIIGMTPQTLFPNRYSVNGKSIVRDYPCVQRLSERKKLINGKDSEANRHETER